MSADGVQGRIEAVMLAEFERLAPKLGYSEEARRWAAASWSAIVVERVPEVAALDGAVVGWQVGLPFSGWLVYDSEPSATEGTIARQGLLVRRVRVVPDGEWVRAGGGEGGV